MKKTYRRWLIVFLILLISAAAYWFFHRVVAYTGDAYVRANWVKISPRVEGHIKSVMVKNNQYVQADDLLMEIEKHPYQLLLDEKRSRLKEAEARYKVLQTKLLSAGTELKALSDKYGLSMRKKERFESLVKKDIIPRQEYEDLLSEIDDVKVKLLEMREETKFDEEIMAVQMTVINYARSELALAEYELSMTDIRAPSSGYVTNAYMRPGDFAHKGEAVFGIVETGQWWVEANYKENLIGRIRPGQKVWISTSLHAFKILQGRVISIGRGISREPGHQKTLPYISPTIDWIRLQRRFPVRIELLDVPKCVQLHMGANARTFVELLSDRSSD
jgi:multidrug resistance efflux pump